MCLNVNTHDDGPTTVSHTNRSFHPPPPHPPILNSLRLSHLALAVLCPLGPLRFAATSLESLGPGETATLHGEIHVPADILGKNGRTGCVFVCLVVVSVLYTD